MILHLSVANQGWLADDWLAPSTESGLVQYVPEVCSGVPRLTFYSAYNLIQ